MTATSFRRIEMISINNVLPSQIQQRQEENAAAFSRSEETACEKCLKGLHGKRPDGFYVARPATKDSVEVIGVCARRKECSRLADYQTDRVAKAKKYSGMADGLLAKTVNGYLAESQYQKAAKSMAANYVKDCFDRFAKVETPHWFYLGGQSGCGKTHLCAAAANALMSKGRYVKYCAYTDLLNALMSFEYDRIEKLKTCKVLFLDDLFKVEPNERELKTIFDLIDYRYRYNLQTIISSEKQLSEIEMIDAAIAGRIMERCGRFFMGIASGSDRNYRKQRLFE